MPTAPPPTAVERVAASRITLWGAFVLVHLWLGMVNLHAATAPLGDLTVYRYWTEQGLVAHYWPGIDGDFVYPLLALVPMLAARALGPDQFAGTWLSMVMLLDVLAFAAITGWAVNRGRPLVAWWWLGFLLLLGPIAMGRIDSVTVPVAIVGVLLLATRPRAAALLLTVATWIKVWPAALLAAIVVSSRHRVAVAVTAAGASAAIVVTALALGSGGHVFSFVSEQTGRGLQVEAPVTTWWLWRALLAPGDTTVYYDHDILTYQVHGPAVAVVAGLMTPLLAVVALGIVALGVRAARRGADALELLPPLALALVAALITVNKVGSPQFVGWLAVPVVLGLATRHAGRGRSFAVPAVLALVLAALTQAVYPYLYDQLITLHAGMLVVITLRNALHVVLLVWAVRELAIVGAHAAPLSGDNGGVDDEGAADAPPRRFASSQRGGTRPTP